MIQELFDYEMKVYQNDTQELKGANNKKVE